MRRVLRSGRPLLIADVSRHDSIRAGNLGTRSLLLVPLGPRRRPLGVLSLGSSTPASFGADDARLAYALALRAGVALEMARRCRHMRQQYSTGLNSPQTLRRRSEQSARARRRAELTRQLIGRE